MSEMATRGTPSHPSVVEICPVMHVERAAGQFCCSAHANHEVLHPSGDFCWDLPGPLRCAACFELERAAPSTPSSLSGIGCLATSKPSGGP
jgi:hypothetical protein